MNHPGGFVFATLVLLGPAVFATPAHLEHRPLRCWPSDRFPVVSLNVSSPSGVRTVKIYYRAEEQTTFYFEESVASASGSVAAVMPMASSETRAVVYFIEVVNRVFESTRTPERSVPVSTAAECDDDEPAVWFDGDDPGIVVRSVDANAPRIPPGFRAAGLAVSDDSSTGLVVGLLAGGAAAGVVVAVGGTSSGTGTNEEEVEGTGVEPVEPTGSGSNPTEGTSTPNEPGSGPSSPPPPNPSPNPAPTPPTTTTTSVLPDADVWITLTDSPDPLPAGNPLTYRMDVGNDGPETATNVAARLRFSRAVSLTSAPGSCSGLIGTRIDCDFGTLDDGARRSINVVIVPLIPGTLDATAEVSADEPDPNPSNNTASTSTTIVALSKALSGSSYVLRSRLEATSPDENDAAARAVIRAGGRSIEVPGANDVAFAAPGDGWIEAHVLSPGAEGTWRFEIEASEAPVRFEIGAGQPMGIEPLAVLFHVNGETRIRFRMVR